MLIKDDVTPRHFDLNQYYTYKYSHRLQPLDVARGVVELAHVIQTTLGDTLRQYSMVKKMAIQLQAIEATKGVVTFGHDIQSQADLARKLVGTCWRKRNGVETIVFRDEPSFDYHYSLKPGWSRHEYSLGRSLGSMILHWKMDNFNARCKFADDFSHFVEADDLQFTWYLEWAP